MIHIVGHGYFETLFSIAKLYKVTVEDLRRWNHLPDNLIRVGQHLIVSEPGKTQPPRKSNILTISDVCATNDDLPQRIADAIYIDHLRPIQSLTEALGMKIHVITKDGLRSGYRPLKYELSKGRNGSSEHTFTDTHPAGTGAMDWRCDNMELLLEQLIAKTNYRRIAVYDSFIHCDYRDILGQRRLYKGNIGSAWTFLKTI